LNLIILAVLSSYSPQFNNFFHPNLKNMNQFEEFNKYIYRQVHEEDNQVFIEEPKEEENLVEEEDNKINIRQSESNKKYEKKSNTSNRLNAEHKRYTTYTMEYKRQIIQEVIIKIIIIHLF
jgi:tRNA A37 threonylcarbamoyladenosine biosynthesis protein TsaE